MNKSSKYQQVVNWVRDRIAACEVNAGDKLESENEISRQFNISRQTVRHALDLLVQDGIVERRQGSGTYVKAVTDRKRKQLLPKEVSIISTYVDGYIFSRIIQSMVNRLEKDEYGVKLMFTNNHLESERRILERMLEEGNLQPLIVEPVMSGLPNPNLYLYRSLMARGVPILFFHSFYPELNAPHISIDDEMAGRIAAEHLIARGHTRIAGIFKADDGQGRRRYFGYIKALLAAGIEVREQWILWIDTHQLREPLSLNHRILKRLEECTACVCYNDEVAHVLTEICCEEHVCIPDDLSIVSIDNSELARLNSVPLTSVVHPMEELGKKVAENMLQLIENPDFDASFEFEPRLEQRGSVQSVTAM